ncbi:sulfurtransferase [Dyadobacter sp. CY323]|uniref:sulfurtransferase n=1 Tax=Dyadobacter sp. CY323 TaxID=2907302 RepID=UPI001F3E091B|nr:sulfurtransferase [Dyadobacter sp. CY323]MCE6990025.1 sulfurtransferase [Dyadobacter sp. CY323]
MKFNRYPFIMNIITTQKLKDISSQEQVIFVDARGGADAFERYKAAHLEHALFADLETDLSEKGENAANGGRHPLPEPGAFSAFLGKLGIAPSSTVVVYDDKKGANAAARFWWMLKAAGHENVYVLSGGLDALKAADFPITQEIPGSPAETNYPLTEWKLPTVDMNHISEISTDPDFMVIDVREHYRYIGESEPIDLVAGHIPGAVNIAYTSNLDESGEFKSVEALREMYKSAIADRKIENVIVHCGSGVTACHTLLALSEAGFDGAGLYVGSWSEWSRNDKPIAIGNN